MDVLLVFPCHYPRPISIPTLSLSLSLYLVTTSVTSDPKSQVRTRSEFWLDPDSVTITRKHERLEGIGEGAEITRVNGGNHGVMPSDTGNV